ncbi:hypothetical protein E0E50_15870 [Azotobacter chroococcum subsp. isscasi]|nr:hypothetical protein E0E50_15870 [Azotobacter chroococcum subsp. isscasi]
MYEQSASTLAMIGTTLISSHKVLKLLQDVPLHQPLGADDLREAVYLGYQPWAARLPDHVFSHSWKLLEQCSQYKGQSSLVLGALRAIASEFLESRHGKLHVRQPKFGTWQQGVTSRISGLPLQAAAHVLAQPRTWLTTSGKSFPHRNEPTTWANRNLPVVSPYDPLVEDYLSREGLHETHLHLNGSTHAENCWLQALRAPKQDTKDFSIKWLDRKTGIRELALSINPELSPVELYRQLVAAGHLRHWLIAAASNKLKADAPLPSKYEELAIEDELHSIPRLGGGPLQLAAHSSTADELFWMQLLLHQLENQPSAHLERMLHLYLLLQNQYYRLLVQSEEQFGFDQFQKLTYTELREPAERDYLPRFWAMHGKQEPVSRTTYLEGRFAPKGTLRKNYDILQAILAGYWRYLNSHEPHTETASRPPFGLTPLLEDLEKIFQGKSPLDRSHHRLALVAHFIKKQWSPGKKAGPYRYYAQRMELERTTNVLIETLRRWPRLHTWIRGIDAASNELHAPPEIFSSYYRACQHAGITHRSYHVGEDFAHLLSGLRAMYDALELLDLHNGDRIGHGTAMGISPKLWLERMPGQVVVKKGEWMLDLLAAWRLLRSLPEAAPVAARVATDLARYAGEIFRQDISCTTLEAAMGLRHLNVRYIQAAIESNWTPSITPLGDIWQAEAQLVRTAQLNSPQHLKLLWDWLSDSTLWQRSEELVSIDTAYFDTSTYLQLQQILMREVARRCVVIETLPSSNVRISQYMNFSEHHALRWMRVPGFVQKGDPEIMVSLGSDDPGIFAGDLNGEFYQLYSVLRSQGLNDQAALAYLAPVNERGRVYRFHDPTLG